MHMPSAILLIALSSLAAAPQQQPDPAPPLPGTFDPFDPPAAAAPPPGAPGVSQWTRTAGGDESIVVAGFNFDKHTRFSTFCRTAAGTRSGRARVAAIDAFRAVVTLPPDIPAGVMVLLTPENAAGAGRPFAVNRTEAWWIAPRKAAAGETVSLYGRNLSYRLGTEKAWVYLKPKDSAAAGTWAAVTAANPYKVDFTVPEGAAAGAYEIWAHNGSGGPRGWSALHAGRGGGTAPKHLAVVAPRRWDGPVIDVTTLGARGDGKTDDTEAVLAALARANRTRNATIHFPAGTYLVSKTIGPVRGPEKSGVRIRGAGMDKTFVKGNPGKLPATMLLLEGNGIEIRDIVFDINALGETAKLYRGATRPAHDPKHYEMLEEKKRIRDEEKRKNRGKKKPAQQKKKKRVKRVVVKKKGYGRGLRLVDCVFDGERHLSMQLTGPIDALIENCDIVGRECQLGCPQYARIDRCNFYGRADAPVLIYIYGGWCISVTNCTGQDYRANTYDTCMGRFFTVTAYGNRHENVYIADNRTTDLTVQPMHFNQNAGEQIMWEDLPAVARAVPASVDGKTLTFAEPIAAPKLNWYSTAVVVAGKGLGQYRQIMTYDKKTRTATLTRPWDVDPDAGSTIRIARPVMRAVVYRNRLDAKPRAHRSEHHIASCGVEPFGASVELIVDGNTFHELRSGIATFSLGGKGGPAPTLFNYYANNVFDTVRRGQVNNGPTLGVVSRRNRMKDVVLTGFRVNVKGKAGRAAMAMNAFEHNRFENVPVAIRAGTAKHPGAIADLLFYRNELGDAAVECGDPSMLILRDNRPAAKARRAE